VGVYIYEFPLYIYNHLRIVLRPKHNGKLNKLVKNIEIELRRRKPLTLKSCDISAWCAVYFSPSRPDRLWDPQKRLSGGHRGLLIPPNLLVYNSIYTQSVNYISKINYVNVCHEVIFFIQFRYPLGNFRLTPEMCFRTSG
jgi:hypothetical protein